VNSESFCSFFSFIKIVTFCQDWIVNNVIPPEEVVGSLAVQMNQRALDQERVRTFSLSLFTFLFNLFQARHERELEEAEREEERANRAAQELDEQIQADAMRQLMAKEQQYKARKRANSEATEVPFMGEGDFQVPTEVFAHEMEIDGVRFNAVKLFHPRSGKFFSFSFPFLFVDSPLLKLVSG
jgi:translation initiation factor 2-alpha kinase 4